MKNLTSMLHLIRVVTSTAAALTAITDWVDAPLPIVAGSTVTPGNKITNIAAAATTTVVLRRG